MDDQHYFRVLSELSEAITQDHFNKGGKAFLQWEELNVQEGREASLYSEETTELLLQALKAYLEPIVSEGDLESKFHVEMADCGLCIDIPPITKPQGVEVMEILGNFLHDEDLESIEWDPCDDNGYMLW